MAAARRAVLVTGCSSGIGWACALRLASAGFDVHAGVRSEEASEALAAASPRIAPLICDVTDATAISSAAERIATETSGRLAGLVNNAGIGVGGPIETVALDELRRQLEVNVVGQVAVTQAVLPMIRSARGRIVFIGSMSGRLSSPFLGPYGASKHAIEAIGDSLRGELQPFGVEVSIVEPGAIATEIWSKAQTQADEIRASLDEEQRRLYGERIEVFAEAARKAGEEAIGADRVAEAVEHALTARRPRTRYVVGADARILAGLKRWLPDRPRDRLIAKGMGI